MGGERSVLCIGHGIALQPEREVPARFGSKKSIASCRACVPS